MSPFTAVKTMSCVGCTIRTLSGNPFGLRLADRQNPQDPSPIGAVAIRVPQGEVVEIKFDEPIKSFAVRTSCAGVAAHPECRGSCVPQSSGYIAKIVDIGGKGSDGDHPFMEPEYDNVQLAAVVVGTRPPVPIRQTRVTLGCHMFAAETVFDSIQVEV